MSKVIICLGVLLVVFVSTITILFICGIPKCNLIKDKPKKLNPLELENIVACDDDAIVNIDAYLAYSMDVREEYLPLKLDSLSRETVGGEQKLGMEMNCSTISLTLFETQAKGVRLMQVETIKLNLLIPFGRSKSCQIKMPPNLYYKVDEHYFCDKQIVLDCLLESNLAPQNKKVYLVLNTFEFELNGNKTMYNRGEFSTPRFYCTSDE